MNMTQNITASPATTSLSVAYVITELRNRGWIDIADRLLINYGKWRQPISETIMISGDDLRRYILNDLQSIPQTVKNVDAVLESVYTGVVRSCSDRANIL